MVQKWKITVLGVVMALACLMGTGLAEGGLTLTDMKGRQLQLDGPVTRVVAIAPSDCEILYAIGAEGVLVGRGMDCNYPETALELPMVQSGVSTNVEEIIALEPQVVLMNTMGQTLEQVEALEAAGIPVMATEATDIAGVYGAIGLLGALTGKEAEAAALVVEMQTALAKINENAVANAGKTVYFEVSPLEFGLWTAGKNTFMDELTILCGLENAFADVEGWAEVSQEQVIARSPSLIVTTMPQMEGVPSPVEEIKGRAGWETVSAVAGNGVLSINGDWLSRPGPRLVLAAQALAAAAAGLQ